MPKRSSNDLNETAFNVVQQSTEQTETPAKNPAAVALGRLGGLKGGMARAAALSVKRRKQIAANAAKARWSSKAQ